MIAIGYGVVDIEDTLCATPEKIVAILTAANLIQGDTDGNGTVECADFLLLSNNLGRAVGTVAAVPEPTGSVLILFGVLLLLWSRRGFHGT